MASDCLYSGGVFGDNFAKVGNLGMCLSSLGFLPVQKFFEGQDDALCVCVPITALEPATEDGSCQGLGKYLLTNCCFTPMRQGVMVA